MLPGESVEDRSKKVNDRIRNESVHKKSEVASIKDKVLQNCLWAKWENKVADPKIWLIRLCFLIILVKNRIGSGLTA